MVNPEEGLVRVWMDRGLDACSLLAEFIPCGPSCIEEEGVPDSHVAAGDEEVHGRNLCPDLCVGRGECVICLDVGAGHPHGDAPLCEVARLRIMDASVSARQRWRNVRICSSPR